MFNFGKISGMKNYTVKFSDMDSAIRASKMFELKKQSMISIVEGRFKDARTAQKECAKIAVEDFDAFTKLPKVNIHNMPLSAGLSILWQSLKFRVYNAFCRKTTEEKELAIKTKEYIKNTTPEEQKQRTIDVTIPSIY